MGPYEVQHWHAWLIVVVLLMLGAWMRMGSYLLLLGIAAIIALIEAWMKVRLPWQVATFVAASLILSLIHWAMASRKGGKGKPSTGDTSPPAA